MIIENIKYNEKTSMFDVKIDEDIYKVSYEVYEDLSLKKDMELTIDQFNRLIDENEYQIAKKKADRYISYKLRSKKEVFDRLYRDIKNTKAIDKVVNHYEKIGLLNDDYYAKAYLDHCLNIKNYSLKFTEFKMKEKGISSDIYEKYLEEYDHDIDYINASILFNKKFKNKDLNDYKDQQKVYRYLAGKAFSYDLIKRLLNESK